MYIVHMYVLATIVRTRQQQFYSFVDQQSLGVCIVYYRYIQSDCRV